MAAPRNILPDPSISAQVRARMHVDGGPDKLALRASVDSVTVVRVAAELPVRRATLAMLQIALGSQTAPQSEAVAAAS